MHEFSVDDDMLHSYILCGLCWFRAGRGGRSSGGTYARLLMLSSTEDISASSFRTDEGVSFDKFSLPYEMLHLDITDRLSLSGTVRGGI